MEDTIKASELRIGNFIDCGGLYVPYETGEVAEICADSVVVKINEKYHSYLYEDLKPIPLTEEWHRRLPAVYTWDAYETVICITISTGDYEIKRDLLQSVHQWQNLYIALTGTELLTAPSGENKKG